MFGAAQASDPQVTTQGEVESLRLPLPGPGDGPFADDVFWVLSGSGQQLRVPQSAGGSDMLLARLQELPGFDSRAGIAACRPRPRRRCRSHLMNSITSLGRYLRLLGTGTGGDDDRRASNASTAA
jgi:hypothetical protein